MEAKYYAGKWNNHDIVLVMNSMTDGKTQLRFDGKVIADGGSIFHMDRGMTGKIPDDPELSSYDKSSKTYRAEYYDHKLEAYTKKLNYNFIIDGEEADKRGGVLATCAILGSQADENGKRMMAVFSPSGLKDTCQFYAEAENVKMYPCRRQGGELVPITTTDNDDGFLLGFMLGMNI